MSAKANEYLKTEIQHRTNSFRSSMDWYRRRHFLSRMGTAALSATIAVLSGLTWDDLPPEVVRNVILLLSSVSTVVAVWGGFLSPQESWHLYAQTHGKLRALQDQIGFEEAKQSGTSTDQHFKTYQKVLAEHNEAWQAIREKVKNP